MWYVETSGQDFETCGTYLKIFEVLVKYVEHLGSSEYTGTKVPILEKRFAKHSKSRADV